MRQAVQQHRVQQGVWRVRTARIGLHIRLPGALQALVFKRSRRYPRTQ